jgi:cystathionine beta-lyase
MRYLDRNRRLVDEWAASVNLGHHLPESTYLAWLDCRRLEIQAGTTLQEHFLDRAKVALSEGSDFGGPGVGHVRLNFATSIDILEEILSRLSKALD